MGQDQTSSSRGFLVWVETSLRKVFKDKALVKVGGETQAFISAARGEYESFQVVVSPREGGDLKNVEVEVSDLSSESGSYSIPRRCVEAYLVGYIQNREAGYPVEHVGLWPDPLMPLKPFNVKDGEVQPVWVTVYVPRDAREGLYKGTVTIRPQGLGERMVTVKLRVWGFSLPSTPHLKTAFGFTTLDHGSAFRRFYPAERFNQKEIIKRFLSVLRRHGVNILWYGYVTTRDPYLLRVVKDGGVWRYDFTEVEELLEFIVSEGFSFNIFAPTYWYEASGLFALNPLLKEFDYLGDKVYSSEEFELVVRQLLESYVDYLRKRGWLDRAICYISDEPRRERDFIHAKRIAHLVKEVSPTLKTVIASGYIIPSVAGEDVDVWCVHLGCFEEGRRLIEERRAEGDEIWWYVSNSPNYPYPTLFLDFPAVSHRIIFWMAWKYGVKGFGYWNTTYWHDGQLTDNFREDPEERWPKGPWNPLFNAKTPANGCGQLIYPGPDGPIVSIRLSIVRDGIEDYEYLYQLNKRVEMLREAMQRSPDRDLKALMSRARRTLDRIDELVRSTAEYEKNPDKIYKVRNEVAELIEEINNTLEIREPYL